MKKIIGIVCLLLISTTQITFALSTPKSKHKKHLAKVKAQNKTPEIIAAPAQEKAHEDGEQSWLKGFSGTYTLASNYIFRGLSQTENLPAIQGGLTYTFPIGFYLNAWGSNVKFNDGKDASVELDTIIGWRGTYKENFSYDLSLARYNYPGAVGANYNEGIVILGYRFLQATIGYSANAYNVHKSGTYYNGGVKFDLPPKYFFHLNDVTLQAGIGHYSLPRAAGNSYNDYNIALNKKINDTYSLAAIWTGTNHKNPPYDQDYLVGQINASF